MRKSNIRRIKGVSQDELLKLFGEVGVKSIATIGNEISFMFNDGQTFSFEGLQYETDWGIENESRIYLNDVEVSIG